EIYDSIEYCLSAQWLEITDERFPRFVLTPLGAAQIPSIPEPLPLDMYTQAPTCIYPDLLHQARRLMFDIASLYRIPPHIIIDDTSLVTLVNKLPRTMYDITRELQYSSNIFIYRCAPRLLDIVRTYVRQQTAQQHNPLEHLPHGIQQSIRMLLSGYSIEEVAQRHRLPISTVAHHIHIALDQGISLPRERFVHDSLYATVKEFLRTQPYGFVQDIRSVIHEEVEAWKIRIAAAFARKELYRNTPT
ncbi:MAG: helix-turn-helix domain-containing protein, partial [Bacteroidota bacterium]|nr:helix-turn-helix domain-containing protein [Candidatus Kapabacteria bacterium]MDW8220490.1 helix-turn-helix domain-containing protein [Bacteroidota bacterium]